MLCMIHTCYIDNSDAVDECISLPCQNGGTCLDGITSYQCTCVDPFTGGDCESGKLCYLYIGTEFGIGKLYYSTLTYFRPKKKHETYYSLMQKDDSFMQTAVRIINPCKCGRFLKLRLINTYVDDSDAVDECISSPCQNGGACLDGITSYQCTCVDPFTGADCESGKLCHLYIGTEFGTGKLYHSTLTIPISGKKNTND